MPRRTLVTHAPELQVLAAQQPQLELWERRAPETRTLYQYLYLQGGREPTRIAVTDAVAALRCSADTFYRRLGSLERHGLVATRRDGSANYIEVRDVPTPPATRGSRSFRGDSTRNGFAGILPVIVAGPAGMPIAPLSSPEPSALAARFARITVEDSQASLQRLGTRCSSGAAGRALDLYRLLASYAHHRRPVTKDGLAESLGIGSRPLEGRLRDLELAGLAMCDYRQRCIALLPPSLAHGYPNDLSPHAKQISASITGFLRANDLNTTADAIAHRYFDLCRHEDLEPGPDVWVIANHLAECTSAERGWIQMMLDTYVLGRTWPELESWFRSRPDATGIMVLHRFFAKFDELAALTERRSVVVLNGDFSTAMNVEHAPGQVATEFELRPRRTCDRKAKEAWHD